MSDSYFDELQYSPNAIEFLSKRLKDGTLVLFLGAGVSKGFGLPDWISLVNAIRKEINLELIKKNSSAEDLQNAADEAKTEIIKKVSDESKGFNDFISLIRRHLYAKISNLSPSKVFENHLLIALSSLLMGSKRGHVRIVVTLNFDSMLEWFLSLFGFAYRSIYQLPSLEGSEDVRIYHPNGFIPFPELNVKGSDFIIFGMDDIDERLGSKQDPWFELIRRILDTSICLFIGMSRNTLSDRSLSPLLKTSGKVYLGKRPLGIWILKEKLTKTKESEFKRKNIVPISILEERDISDFILKICQKALV